MNLRRKSARNTSGAWLCYNATMHTLTSRPEKRLDRNTLFKHEQELVDKEATMIASELRLWLPDDERIAIKSAASPDDIPFRTELGRAIRNEYDLWLEEHHITKIWLQAEREFPLSEDGPTAIEVPLGDGRIMTMSSNKPLVFDDHPCHPDNFSAYCMKKLWEMLQ